MKVTFRRTLYGDSAHGLIYSNVSPTDIDKVEIEGQPGFCCEEMGTEWTNEDVIGFGPRDNYGKVTEDDIAVNIYQRGYYDSYEWCPIKFCPFCGEAIEYEEMPPLTRVKRIEEVPAIPATEKVTYESVPVDNRDGGDNNG